MNKIITIKENPNFYYADRHIYLKNNGRFQSINEIKREFKKISPDVKVVKNGFKLTHGFNIDKNVKLYDVTLNDEIVGKIETHQQHHFRIETAKLETLYKMLEEKICY